MELSFPLGITGFVLHRTKFYPRQKPVYRFPVVPVSVESKNEKSECVNENENKENKNVDELHEIILQQKPANTGVTTKCYIKTWKRFCLQENLNRELCGIRREELNLLMCKIF